MPFKPNWFHFWFANFFILIYSVSFFDLFSTQFYIALDSFVRFNNTFFSFGQCKLSRINSEMVCHSYLIERNLRLGFFDFEIELCYLWLERSVNDINSHQTVSDCCVNRAMQCPSADLKDFENLKLVTHIILVSFC